MIMTTRLVKMLAVLLCAAMMGQKARAEGRITLFSGEQPLSYHVEGKAAPVVTKALQMFSDDVRLVQMGKAGVVSKPDATMLIYQLDANKKASAALRKLQVPVGEVASRMDAFWIGVRQGKLLVVGSNGRGTAYGILELSRLMGVSPWVWWGDVKPHTSNAFSLPSDFESLQSPSVEYRGIFINDEDWSLRPWSAKTFEPGQPMGPKTYREIFKLLLRLRANALWPAMHEGTPAFFSVKGNKEMADSFGVVIGTSHCEPLLRNNVAEWDVKQRGPYNYMTNRKAVSQYWTERLRQVAGSEELFTIGMRGIHDGSMEGVKTPEEKLNGLQQVIDDQRELLRKYVNKDVTRVPQVFIPYKEVLEIMESGLRVPDDVMLMWCDDNYGYLTRLPDSLQQQRRGGGGVYYHLSYWGRPHDHLWLTTTQPGLIYNEMRAAYDHNCRRLWIANVHDPKVAAYDLELFLDMAWNIDCVQPQTLQQHLERWLSVQFGPVVGHAIAPAMQELYRLNAIRKPEFMGWTQVELDKKKYPGGKSVPTTTEFTLKQAYERMNDFARIEATVDVYASLVHENARDAYFAHVLYPVHASAAMTRKMLSQPVESRRAYEEIQSLTERYNALSDGKWSGLMSAAPRQLPVFGQVRTELPQHPVPGRCVARNACSYTRATEGVQPIQLLGHSMNAVSIPKGGSLTFEFETDIAGDAQLYTAMIPTQPSDRGDLRYSVSLDGAAPVVISLKEPYRSERWKQNVLRAQALKATPVRVSKGKHTLVVKALDDHIILDQWMLDTRRDRSFYVIPVHANHE